MRSNGMRRRYFLKIAGVFAVLFNFPRMAWSFFLEKFPVRTVEKGTWSLNPATGELKGPAGVDGPYQLVVDGLVEKPFTIPYAELRALPYVEQVSDFHCVEGWSVPEVRWGGFRIAEVFKKAKVKPGATHVVFHSLGETRGQPGGQDHYIESLPLDKLLNSEAQILMVLDMNGEPLTFDHGAPLRVISPFDLAYKSIKYVRRIEVTAAPQDGWWTLANPIYPIEAPVPAYRLRKK
ncbi:MAG: molybdopterin-dependent oxidoreductase [Deltaproteobacteria bacterium]|nr:molybdopterin-dependent oxidoreductase [Deltaproteobacteria bacterium]